ncbi:MAG: superinfection immunity protein [Candidatus Latescibacteria bacterium]|nr:superinfection immunity protein [Candidatus Latescibacterota bacterium]
MYFIPAFVANERKHHNTTPILLLNLFLGWTFLGWVGALIWACTKVEKTPSGGRVKFANPPLSSTKPETGDQFCAHCGTKLAENQVTSFCAHCGTAIAKR